MVSPVESFCDDFADYNEPFLDISLDAQTVPQDFLDKFQENLTEIDRLKMVIEDMIGNFSRPCEFLHEISLTKEQISSLNSDTGTLIKENASNALLRLGKGFFILESVCKPDKIIYFADNIQSTKSFNCSFQRQQNNASMVRNYSHIESNLFRVQAELEKRYIAISQREEKLRTMEEELGYKIQKLESIKNEYFAKLGELNMRVTVDTSISNYSPGKTSFSSSDRTQSYGKHKEKPTFTKDMYQALTMLEKIVKEKYSKKRNVVNSLENTFTTADFSRQFSINRKCFNESMHFSRFSNKESYILKYIKKQHKYQDLKFQEIRDYEKYLQETWVESFGNEKVVNALQRSSQKNFQIAQMLRNERLQIDEKNMRLQKLIEITKSENSRLEFHRKKIWNERQALIKQQSEIENAFQKLLTL